MFCTINFFEIDSLYGLYETSLKYQACNGPETYKHFLYIFSPSCVDCPGYNYNITIQNKTWSVPSTCLGENGNIKCSREFSDKHLPSNYWNVTLTYCCCRKSNNISIYFKPTNGSVNTGSWKCRQNNNGWVKAHTYETNGYLISEILLCIPGQSSTSNITVQCRKTNGKSIHETLGKLGNIFAKISYSLSMFLIVYQTRVTLLREQYLCLRKQKCFPSNSETLFVASFPIYPHVSKFTSTCHLYE